MISDLWYLVDSARSMLGKFWIPALAIFSMVSLPFLPPLQWVPPLPVLIILLAIVSFAADIYLSVFARRKKDITLPSTMYEMYFLCICIPICEELYYRVLLPRLMPRIMCNMLFGFIHTYNYVCYPEDVKRIASAFVVVVTFLLAMICDTLLAEYNDVLYPILFHIIFNIIQIFIAMLLRMMFKIEKIESAQDKRIADLLTLLHDSDECH